MYGANRAFFMSFSLSKSFWVLVALGLVTTSGPVQADQGALQAIREAGGIVRSMGGGWEIEFQRISD